MDRKVVLLASSRWRGVRCQWVPRGKKGCNSYQWTERVSNFCQNVSTLVHMGLRPFALPSRFWGLSSPQEKGGRALVVQWWNCVLQKIWCERFLLVWSCAQLWRGWVVNCLQRFAHRRGRRRRVEERHLERRQRRRQLSAKLTTTLTTLLCSWAGAF